MDTRTSEATLVSAKPSEQVYCILCERMVTVEQGARGMIHANGDGNGEPINCHFEGGYAYFPPPETPPHPAKTDWLDDFFSDDWAAQDTEDDWCADEVGAWED